jgi:CRISPR-associated endonuclease/helicase Cas3
MVGSQFSLGRKPPAVHRSGNINLTGELPGSLSDIRKAKEAAQRVLDEVASTEESPTVDLADPELIDRYFQYYFFERRRDMDYPVGPDRAERDDTLLNMLADNKHAVAGCKPAPPIHLRQAFMTAAEAFQTIDANTQGVIVPYTADGSTLISDLCSAYEPKRQFALLKRAQRFTVNVRND